LRHGVPEESLTDTERRVVASLMEFGEPVSGRRVAAALQISPTTAITALGHLRELGLVESRAAGRAVLWAIREGAPSVARLFRRQGAGNASPTRAQGPAPADADRWQPVASGDADRNTLTAVVFTAIPLEYEAVRRQLGSCSRARSPIGTRFEVGRIRGDRTDWDVYLAEIGMGNASSAAEVTAAVTDFDPALVLFVGVAGGLKPDDQARGDVVIADRVYNVHSGKHAAGPDGASEVLSRPVSLPTSHRLTQLVREVARSRWQPRVAPTAGRAPHVHLKPIVAGEVVLADQDSELRQRIGERFNDAGAIDMESYGVYEASHRTETPALAIRGLSDLIGDKRAAEDRRWQPRAAANAAEFAVALLRRADDDDFPPGRRIPPRPPSSRRQIAAPESEDALDRLAPNLRPWWRRLRLTSPARANAALKDLAAHSESPIGWLGRTRHRPPAWLREDDNGDAWALLARFAASHGSPHATSAHERAAELAASAGWDTIAAVHRLAAAVSHAEHPTADVVAGDAGNGGRAEAVRRLRAEQSTVVGPLAAFLSAAVEGDHDGTLSAAGPAVWVLGLDPVSLGLPLTTTGVGDEASEAALAELGETDPDVVAELRSQILLSLANLRLRDDDTDTALRILTLAREIAPAATTPLLLTAQAHLQRVASPAGQRSNVDDTTAVLADVEQMALLVRDRRRDWNGPTAEALALAGRARAQSDDFEGALRLLLPPPRGRATDREAADPAVREVAAAAATFAGEPLLAVELASGVTDPVERHLLRAVALSRAEGMGDEAERSYRTALDNVPDTRPDQLVRALLGMARLGIPITADVEGNIADAIARLRRMDPEAAVLVEASAALHAGRPRDALVLARQYPQSIAAMELAAEAAAAAGQPEEAIRVLERVGRERGDNSLLVQAMLLAADGGRREDAERLSTMLLTAPDSATRRQALQARLQAAGREGRWQDVADLSRRLLDDEDLEPAEVNRPARNSYRWALAQAEFNLGRPQRALAALQAPDPVVPRSREEARLLLAVLHTTATDPSRGPAPQDVVMRALEVAAEWSDDEEIIAGCLGLAIMTAAKIPLPDQLLVRLRTLQEDYFTRFPDPKILQRIDVGEDLDGLVQHMKETVAPRTEALQDLVRRVWLGIYPLAVLADVTHRSYAELLITRALGCRVIAGDPSVGDLQRTAARDALASGTVVMDTSALHLLGHTGVADTRLTAQFARTILPASLRDDILRAKAGLAFRSVGTLWWDSAKQRPALTEFPPELADRWAVEAQELVDRLSLVDVVADPVGRPEGIFDSALLLAKDQQLLLWADDVALLQVAESLGVRAFGTLDLIGVLVESGALTGDDEGRALDVLVKDGAVDLPVLDRLVEFARDAGWKLDGYAALLLARPRSWIPPSAGFGRYRALIGALPQDIDDTSFVQWAEAAATGLAWASPPPARPSAIATILAWTILNKPSEAVVPALLDAGERVQKAAAPDGDVLPHFVTILADTISQVEGPAKTAIIMTRLLGSLDEERRIAAMQLFLSPPRSDT
jgi:nucleoside phosphorylase/predicted nucleic acid-binding protein/biotin operon repressor